MLQLSGSLLVSTQLVPHVVPVVPKMAPLVSALAEHFASYRLT